ncbi:hypothetical protein TCAL_01040 [Tigriopus californicus]|uniref:ABC transporter domain-containing protein n=1 Tax=Tigriopus californicus TaxID=6832 RepID=A0A553P488_TIGCA|nr:ATP-binding cassette subfamily G member 4-like [Tigriopus californicus]TRY72483.1 hypothetical protein TCAL_01040 [Tigriopus californicus]
MSGGNHPNLATPQLPAAEHGKEDLQKDVVHPNQEHDGHLPLASDCNEPGSSPAKTLEMVMISETNLKEKQLSSETTSTESNNVQEINGVVAYKSEGIILTGVSKTRSNQNPERKMMTNLAKRPPVDIEFKDLVYSVPEKHGLIMKTFAGRKTILKGVSGKLKSGELIAIMGPSGAGKSTLMNIMAGYRTSNVTGEISINGKTRNLRKFRKMSCYIMQDDCLSPNLTVKEAMEIATNLKLGEETPLETKALVIKEITDNLGLTECLETRTNMISGGQRKRLAIGLELVNNPPVMFLDEPTSGLDSASCSQCISLLKQLAREGRTIICTIHQPSARIFEMFDKLYILADGQNVYKGTVKGLVPFLSSMGLDCPSYHNPADFVMEIATGEYGNYTETLVDAVNAGKCTSLGHDSPSPSTKSSQDIGAGPRNVNLKSISEEQPTKSSSGTLHISMPEDGLAGTSNGAIGNGNGNGELQASLLGDSDESMGKHAHTFPTTARTQFRILVVRTFKCIIRDETLTKLRFISHVAIGILLGLLYWDIGNEASKVYNNSAMLFFCMLFSMFTAMMPTVMTFPLEMATFKREHLNYWYSMKSYYLAKLAADLPFQIAFPSIFLLIVYFMTSQPLELTRLGMFLLMCILTSLVAQSLGLVIGCAVDMQSAVYLGPITTIPILLFSGFFVSLNNIPIFLQWLAYAAYVRYGFEGTILAIYGFQRETLQCSIPYCHFKYPKKFLEELAMDEGVFWIDVVSLLAFFVLLRVLGYFVLKFRIQLEK